MAQREQEQGRPLPIGLVIHPESGAPITLEHFNTYLKDSLSVTLLRQDEASKISSYGLRRVSPTLAAELHTSWEERVAAGGWSQAPEMAGANRMPERYSGGRKGAEAHAKLFTALILGYIETEMVKPVLWTSVKQWYHRVGAQDLIQHFRAEAAFHN